MRPSNVETLLVSGELDLATPPQAAAEELLPHLPNGHQVVLAGFGHTTDFWTLQRDAGTHLVTTFLASGRVETRYVPRRSTSRPRPLHRRRPEDRQVLFALALFTVFALLVLTPRRAAGQRGRRARRPAPLFGLGGLALGALLVLSRSRPSRSTTCARRSSVGLPIALGACLASNRRRARAGLAGAVAGALVGAWLGFGAPPRRWHS